MVDILLRIDIPLSRNPSFLPHANGVYKTTLTTPSTMGTYFDSWTDGGLVYTRIVVGSVLVNYVRFAQASSLSNCVSAENSFFWDNDTQTLYVHFPFDEVPRTSEIYIGVQSGYSMIGTSESYYIDDIEYQPRIKSVPNIKKSVDSTQTGKMSFQDISIGLYNGDGALDGFFSDPVPGAEASLVLFDTETSTELEYYTGFLNYDTSTEEEYIVKITDKRKKNNKKVPYTFFDATTYADIESKYVGKLIPEGYGPIKRIKAFPVNGDASSGNVQYKYATDATVLTKVETFLDEIWTDVTASVTGSSVSTGYFELPRTSGISINSSGGLLPCVVTATLRSQVNPGDIIADMNDRYVSVQYDSTNYDTTEWAAEKALLANTNLYMDKQQELYNWFQDLQNGTDYWFVYDIDGSGKRTLRVNDPDRTATGTVEYIEWKDISVDRDYEEAAATVTVFYDEDFEAETPLRIDVNTYEDAVIRQYSTYQNPEYESNLTAQADAQRKADLAAEDQSEMRPIFEVILHEPDISKLTYKLYDIINLKTSRPDEQYWEDVPDEIYSDWSATDEIYSDWSATDEIYSTVGEYVVTMPGRTFWGTVRAQVLGIEYNPSTLEYTLTVRERPESEVV